jgi:hypothetical protein
MSDPQFEHLADAEAFLQSQGFHLIPGTCDWRNATGDDAGCYAIEHERYGQVTGWRIEINRRGCVAVMSRGHQTVYYVAGHAPIYIAPGHLYRSTATPRPSDCVWMVPGTDEINRVDQRELEHSVGGRP